MSSKSKIVFQHRDTSSNANQIRRNGEIPAIIYGSSYGNIPIKISEKDLREELSSQGWHSLKNIDIEGEECTAIIKEVQTDPLTHKIIHIDLERVKPTEIVTTELPVKFIQNRNVVKTGSILQRDKTMVKVKCHAQSVPEFLNVTVNPEINNVYTIADIEASEEITFLDSPKTILASLQWGGATAQNEEDRDNEDVK